MQKKTKTRGGPIQGLSSQIDDRKEKMKYKKVMSLNLELH